MKFLFSKFAGSDELVLDGDDFNHLKALRFKVGDRIDIRNLKDGYSYIYEIYEFSRRAKCTLEFKAYLQPNSTGVSIAWAVVDPSVIQKTLPSLNEIGVDKLIFVYSEFSQRNFRLDFDKFERILAGSSSQCGRNDMMKLEVFDSVDDFLANYDNVSLVDFDGENFENSAFGEILFIGSEGGFSIAEREKFAKKYSLRSQNILRSNTAIIGVASKILL